MKHKDILNYNYFNIPTWPYSDNLEIELITDVLHSGKWWKNVGEQVKKFEKECAEFHHCKQALAVNSGTVALELALEALGIGEGDEVIVPGFTFYSTMSAVLKVKAIPVIVDVKLDNYCIDPNAVEKAITNKTKAIILVHIGGHMADVETINRISKNYNLFVIEDAAHSHGAQRHGNTIGSLSTCAVLSFQNAKLLTAGEGGMILSNDEDFIKRCLLLTNCGRLESDLIYDHTVLGTNARMTEFQGAILRAQLLRYTEQMKKREKNYCLFASLINDIQGIQLQKINSYECINSHYMIMFYYDSAYFSGISRDDFVTCLKKVGIPANIAYKPIYKLPLLTSSKERSYWISKATDDGENVSELVNTEKIGANVVCIFHNVLLAEEQVICKIVDFIKQLQNNNFYIKD